jgi:hypothetical protein
MSPLPIVVRFWRRYKLRANELHDKGDIVRRAVWKQTEVPHSPAMGLACRSRPGGARSDARARLDV